MLNERPHTISSAYEKGHQRPQLQPYTFQPPCEAINENSAEEAIYSNEGVGQGGGGVQFRDNNGTLTKKPPVPQR